MKKKKRKTNKSIIVIIALIIIIIAAVKAISNGDDKEPINENQNQNEQQNEYNEQQNNGEQQEPNKNEGSGETVTSSEPNKYDLSKTIDENNVVTNSSDLEVVVNKKRYLPESYVPEDLVPLDDLPTVLENPEINQLRKVAHDALKNLFDSAKEDGYELKARSGYRSYNTQNSLYKSYVASNGQEAADKYSAKPGQSEHQTGLAIDITAASMNFQLDDTFENTEEGKWVKDNAHKYGFIVRYPKGKESITGYSFEPWHLRYVGVELAKEVYESQMTLEEYFESKAK